MIRDHGNIRHFRPLTQGQIHRPAGESKTAPAPGNDSVSLGEKAYAPPKWLNVPNAPHSTPDGLELPDGGGMIVPREAAAGPIKDAVIVGGGPAGLASAIKLAEKGIKVTVIEARAKGESENTPDHARPHHINLRYDAIEALHELGVADDLMQSTGLLDQEEILESRAGASEPILVDQRLPLYGPKEQQRKRRSPHKWLKDLSASQVRISDVEKALLARAQELGVDIRAGYTAELARPANSDDYSVAIRGVKRSADGGFEATGEAENLGQPGLVVVADGAGSRTREQLGVTVLEESHPTYYLGGHVNADIGAVTRKQRHLEELPNGTEFVRHLMATGHSKYPSSWVSVEVTAKEAREMSRQERVDKFREAAQEVIQSEIKPEDITWGAGQITVVQNRRAEKASVGNNVVLLGDAVGTGSVWVGGGLNLALTTHLDALSQAVDRINSGTRPRASALNTYNGTVQWALSAWHQEGEAEIFGPAEDRQTFQPPETPYQEAPKGFCIFPTIPPQSRLVSPDDSWQILETTGPPQESRVARPDSYPPREFGPDNPRTWDDVNRDTYKPREFTHPKVLQEPVWAESQDYQEAIRMRAEVQGFPPNRNVPLEHLFFSHEPMRWDQDGMPLNPRGPVGLTGRGELGKYGANPAGDAIVFTIKDGKLQMLTVNKGDRLALPGGMQNDGESIERTQAREMVEEALGGPNEKLTQDFTQRIRNGTEVYAGYGDGYRATDNAWVETTATMIFLQDDEAAKLKVKGGDDAIEGASWQPVSEQNVNNMVAAHPALVQRAVQLWQKKSGLVVSKDGTLGVRGEA